DEGAPRRAGTRGKGSRVGGSERRRADRRRLAVRGRGGRHAPRIGDLCGIPFPVEHGAPLVPRVRLDVPPPLGRPRPFAADGPEQLRRAKFGSRRKVTTSPTLAASSSRGLDPGRAEIVRPALRGREIQRGVRKASRCEESMGSAGEIGFVACLDPKVISDNSGESAVPRAVLRSQVASINGSQFSWYFAG